MNLFVYGTLAPGESNEHYLQQLNGTWQNGVVRGQRFESGWGEALGYPGIILHPLGDTVAGKVFSSPELEQYWPILDEFEGEGYQRVLTSVLLASGEIVQAHVYELSEAGRK